MYNIRSTGLSVLLFVPFELCRLFDTNDIFEIINQKGFSRQNIIILFCRCKNVLYIRRHIGFFASALMCEHFNRVRESARNEIEGDIRSCWIMFDDGRLFFVEEIYIY